MRTLLRFDKFDLSATVVEDISVFSFCGLIRRLLKSTKGISCVERHDIWTFDFFLKTKRNLELIHRIVSMSWTDYDVKDWYYKVELFRMQLVLLPSECHNFYDCSNLHTNQCKHYKGDITKDYDDMKYDFHFVAFLVFFIRT